MAAGEVLEARFFGRKGEAGGCFGGEERGGGGLGGVESNLGEGVGRVGGNLGIFNFLGVSLANGGV